ncbi:MAG: ABC transporter permease [Lachnospiraceae bacterium]|nr:ABC transporter permease [Lachnospiraceae bacterium]
MSSFKMALANIKKSMRDYVVYFITLIIGVAIFYVFNSVGDQSVVKGITGSGYDIIELMLILLDGVSIGVAFVLGFLIIYANNFLIKRRKKEFGVYMLLGMDKKQVSKILVSETFLVGVASLVVGLGIGIFASQFVSIIVGKFFEIDMSAYAFTVSGGALLKTAINFAVIYLVVIVFHGVSISKYKLIDLLSAGKKTEKQMLKNPVISTIIFLVSVVALGYAYYRVGFCTRDLNQSEIIRHILVGVVSTVLIFWSMSGFLLSALRGCKKLYNKNLNSFVIRQFCNSINSSAITMAIICLMLFVTICTFASGFSIAHDLQTVVEDSTPVDYSMMMTGTKPVSQLVEEEGMPANQWAADDMVELSIYQVENMTWGSSLGDIKDVASEQFPAVRWETKENIIAVSDYNRLAALYGAREIELGADEYEIVCDFESFKQFRDDAMAAGQTIDCGGYILKPGAKECKNGFIVMSGGSTNTGVVVVPDEVAASLEGDGKISGYLMAGNFNVEGKKEKKEIEQRLLDVTGKYWEMNYDDLNYLPPMTIGTKVTIVESSNGLTLLSTFIVIYMGIVFLIASAALLALKALSESIDSTGRYEILKKIGSDHRMLRKALFAQIAVYFTLPLVVAIIHSIFGMKFAEFAMSAFLSGSPFWGICVTAALMAVLYGGYMLATYRTSKRIVEIEG